MNRKELIEKYNVEEHYLDELIMSYKDKRLEDVVLYSFFILSDFPEDEVRVQEFSEDLELVLDDESVDYTWWPSWE